MSRAPQSVGDSDNESAMASVVELVASVESSLSRDELARLGEIEVHSLTAEAVAGLAPEAGPTHAGGAHVRIAIGRVLLLVLDALSDNASSTYFEWLEQNAGPETLNDLDEYRLLVIERSAENLGERYTNKRPRWIGHGRLTERASYQANEIDELARDGIMRIGGSVDGRWEKIGFVLVREWAGLDLRRLAETQGKELTDEIRKLLPIVGRLNRAARLEANTRAPALDRASWRKPS